MTTSQRPAPGREATSGEAGGVVLIGIDCAVDPRKTGIAVGRINAGFSGRSGEQIVLESARLGTSTDGLVEWLTVALSKAAERSERVLVALDSPLGWPAALGASLARHRAGDGIAAAAPELFLRKTDLFVREVSGKRPLEVGADRIARTARAALGLVSAVREATGLALPMVWSPDFEASGLIEVYPAATLLSRGLPSSRYKKRDQVDVRHGILAQLEQEVEIGPQHRQILRGHADALDAVLCLVAAADFLAGRALPPPDLATAEKEGWIWIPELERP